MARTYSLLIVSFLVLNISNWVSMIEFKYGVPQIVKYVLSVFVLTTLLYYGLTMRSSLLRKDSFYPIFLFFIAYSIFLLISSVVKFDNLLYIQRTFADRTFLIPYLLPVIILFIKFDLNFFGNLSRYATVLMVPVLFLLFYTFLFELDQSRWLEQFERINIFNLASGFLLLTAHLFKKKLISTIMILYYILSITLALIYGRRGVVISGLLLIFFMIIIRLRSPLFSIRQRTKMYLAGILVLLMVLAFGYLLKSTYAFERGFDREGFQESRGSVFTDFFADFTSTKDWIFGRGIQGRVYRSIYAGGTLDIIEQGFLTVILRGGILYLAPFVIIFLRAIYLGFFISNNDLVKALAILIFLHLSLMFYFNLPDFSTYYVFIWISIATCLSPEIRGYSNKDIYLAINRVKAK